MRLPDALYTFDVCVLLGWSAEDLLYAEDLLGRADAGEGLLHVHQISFTRFKSCCDFCLPFFRLDIVKAGKHLIRFVFSLLVLFKTMYVLGINP